MNEQAVFDFKAESYDKEFTHTYVGRVQRNGIYDFVSKKLQGQRGLEILELNCGTGEDIVFLQQFGNVTATDVSEEMLKVASRKNKEVDIQLLDLNHPIRLGKKYDVIFSNFGGLNCVSPDRLKMLSTELSEILNPGGQMFLVLMHNWSMVEFSYFTLKLNFGKALRRIRKRAEFEKSTIYYYSKKEMCKLFSSFYLSGALSTGILLSGEYMNSIGEKTHINDKNTKWLFPVLGADHVLFNFIRPGF
jgi:ubiquinone/menaquinone biosynthesis C-methylase UbiE